MSNSQLNLSEISNNQSPNTIEEPKEKESKRVEWMGSVIIPVVLGLAGLCISWVQFKNQETQIKKSIITEYIDNISNLEDLELSNLEHLEFKEKEEQKNIQRIDRLQKEQREKLEKEALQKNITVQDRLKFLAVLDKEKDSLLAANNARYIARGQTLAALRRLDNDGDSKGFIVIFLYESNLIKLQALSKPDKVTQSESNKQVSSVINLLSGADLRKVQLSKKDLWRVNLKGAILRNANLNRAILKDANLRNANLRNADLRNADLRNADLRNANLRNADLTGACYNGKTKIDREFKPDPRHMREVSPQEDKDKDFKCSNKQQ